MSGYIDMPLRIQFLAKVRGGVFPDSLMALAFAIIIHPICSAVPFWSCVSGAQRSNVIPRLLSHAFVLFRFISLSDLTTKTDRLYLSLSQFTASIMMGRFSSSRELVVKYARTIPVASQVMSTQRRIFRLSPWYPSHPSSRSNQSI